MGMKPHEFWDYSLSEIFDLLESYERMRVEELRLNTIRDCNLGRIISGNISNVLAKVDEITKPWDIYPELFEEEKESYEMEKQQIEMNRVRETRRAYVQEFNRRRRLGGEV